MKKKGKVKYINKTKYPKCWGCNGVGYKDTICNEKYACDACPIKPCKNECGLCNGTGKFKEDNFILIAEDKKGNKIAFQVDGLK